MTRSSSSSARSAAAITAYRWGLVPHWSTDLKAGSRMFNARAETLTTSPAFRDAFARRRCLVPVDCVLRVEARGHGPPAVRASSATTAVRSSSPGCGPAGATRQRPEHRVRRTFSIVTTTPNQAMADLHDRMPVVVPDDAWDALAGSGARRPRRAARPAPAERRDRAADPRRSSASSTTSGTTARSCWRRWVAAGRRAGGGRTGAGSQIASRPSNAAAKAAAGGEPASTAAA